MVTPSFIGHFDCSACINACDGIICRNLRTRRRMSSQKWTIFLVKQGKFKEGIVPAEELGHLQLKTIFLF
jgi:hypothetical protein